MTREDIIELSNNYKTQAERDILKRFFSISPQPTHSDLAKLNYSKNTIVFSCPGESGTSYFRILEPLLAIYRETDEFNLVYTESIAPIHFNIANLIIVHRAGPFHDMAHSVINHWPSHRVKPYIIHNVDDNETNLPRTHPMHLMWQVQKRDQQALRSLRDSNGVEITTRKMKQVMLNHNKNVWITRNYFNWNLPQWKLEKKKPLSDFRTNLTEEQKKHFEFPEEWNDKIVIGWAGLTSHFEDLKKMQPILKAIHDKHPNTVFVLAGMALQDSMYDIDIDPKTREPIIKEKPMEEKLRYKKRVTDVFEGFDMSRMKIYDALLLEDYGWFYSLFDIGIAYIEHNSFNAAKSEIKVVEYMKYGALPVFSNFGGYADLLDIMVANNIIESNEVSLFGCRTEFNKTEWINKISHIIDNIDTEQMNSYRTRFKSFVEDYYNIDNNIINVITEYKRLMEDYGEKQNTQILQLKSLGTTMVV